MKRDHRALNLTVATPNTRNKWGSQNYRSNNRDISNFNYASPTVVPPPSAIPTIGSMNSDDSTPTLTTIKKSLPPLSCADNDSVYSQDSACIILPPSKKVADATPKTALTFAAIWDPDGGFTTISGNQLLSNSNNGTSIYGGGGLVDDDEEYGNGHPDCEPHLPSRFSVTTTSTSNYINVDFGEEDREGWSWTAGKTMDPSRSTSDYLRPGDLHPAWVPQIFNAGYTKPKSSSRASPLKRPEISGPFQLTSSTALPTAVKSVQNANHYGFEYERLPPPPPSHLQQLPPRPQPHPLVRRTSSGNQPRSGNLSRSATASPTGLKRARLPSVFGKLKRSPTTGHIPPPSSSASPPLPEAYENPIRQGWVVVDMSKMKIAPGGRVVHKASTL
ncbi:hypothetical protein E1B28_003584 [Marasmius oreades]|uniref:Uncharacterized protein n=1 Tax=Marasmius oreades TaxID=181124 RepID=A0A9P7RM42_9AGAR|nr:uncharacterized protein E1B28_003584 [Marasmius oreades]KAG7086064.1 hypothetical protein E1B28_003584 [Marasmius oreades]